MGFYDLHTHSTLSIGENSVEEMVEFAKKLGLSGIGIVRYYPGVVDELPKFNDIDVVSCVIIKPSNAQELGELARKARKKAEILMVHGGDYDINRAACENELIDVLCHPELGRKDSGLDHICAKAAADNDVVIELNFREILESYKKNKIYMLSSMNRNIKLCKKYNAGMTVSSGAVTKWGLRSGRELASVANVLGLELGEAIAASSATPQLIVNDNRKKLSDKKWDGVEVV